MSVKFDPLSWGKVVVKRKRIAEENCRKCQWKSCGEPQETAE